MKRISRSRSKTQSNFFRSALLKAAPTIARTLIITGVGIGYLTYIKLRCADDSAPTPGNFLMAKANKQKFELKCESLNEKFDKYDKSLQKATASHKMVTASTFKAAKSQLERELSLCLSREQRDKILKIVHNFERTCNELESEEATSISHQNGTASRLVELEEKSAQSLGNILNEHQRIILKSITGSSFTSSDSVDAVSSPPAPNLNRVFISSLSSAAKSYSQNSRRAFVLKFPGDIMASKVASFREEISAILTQGDAENKDSVSVIIILDSGGGTVTGYGLAAAEIERLKAAGIHVTVCVDQVAASGGYMMACLADRIVAAPFAVLGSIGVVATQPNIAKRLEREGISVDDVTAGKYKRTLTPYKLPTKEDRAKMQADVDDILQLFKAHITKWRPSLNVEVLATGETWLGSEALEKGLCDELGTSEDLLLKLCASGVRVYSVEWTAVSDRSIWKALEASTSALGASANDSATIDAWGRSCESSLLQSLEHAFFWYLLKWAASKLEGHHATSNIMDPGLPVVGSEVQSPLPLPTLLRGIRGVDAGPGPDGVSCTEDAKRRALALDTTGKGNWRL